jgi:predicted membrane metal-binding protein
LLLFFFPFFSLSFVYLLVLLFYCFTVLLFYCFTVLLFYCFTVLLFNCFSFLFFSFLFFLGWQVQDNQITYQGIEVPQTFLEEIATENNAYEIILKNEPTKNQPTTNHPTKIQTTKGQTTTNTNSHPQQIMELLPLTIPSEEGIVFRLAEPLNEPDVVWGRKGQEER